MTNKINQPNFIARFILNLKVVRDKIDATNRANSRDVVVIEELKRDLHQLREHRGELMAQIESLITERDEARRRLGAVNEELYEARKNIGRLSERLFALTKPKPRKRKKA